MRRIRPNVDLSRSPGAWLLAILLALLPLVRTDPAPPRLQAIRIDPSQGTEAELGTLEGAGPALIRRILWYRKEVGPVTGIDELRRIPGIGMLRLHRWSPIIEARVPVGGTGSGG